MRGATSARRTRQVRLQLPAGDRHRAVARGRPAGASRAVGQRHPARGVHDRRQRLRRSQDLRRDLSGRWRGLLRRWSGAVPARPLIVRAGTCSSPRAERLVRLASGATLVALLLLVIGGRAAVADEPDDDTRTTINKQVTNPVSTTWSLKWQNEIL